MYRQIRSHIQSAATDGANACSEVQCSACNRKQSEVGRKSGKGARKTKFAAIDARQMRSANAFYSDADEKFIRRRRRSMHTDDATFLKKLLLQDRTTSSKQSISALLLENQRRRCRRVASAPGRDPVLGSVNARRASAPARPAGRLTNVQLAIFNDRWSTIPRRSPRSCGGGGGGGWRFSVALSQLRV